MFLLVWKSYTIALDDKGHAIMGVLVELVRTWGILKRRSKLATCMDVTELEAPTTPEMTLLRTCGTVPSWHL